MRWKRKISNEANGDDARWMNELTGKANTHAERERAKEMMLRRLTIRDSRVNVVYVYGYIVLEKPLAGKLKKSMEHNLCVRLMFIAVLAYNLSTK